MTEPSQYFKGRTVQEQMNEVIGYVDVRAEEVAAAKADDVLQPAEDAKDAAIAAQEAAEDARDTTLAALPAIQQDITDLKAEDVALDGRLDTVELKVQTAEGNIVTIQGQIVALQTADGQNVKINNINQYAVGLTGNQANITGIKGFTSILASVASGRIAGPTECLDIIKLPLYVNSQYNIAAIFGTRHDIGIGKVTILTDTNGVVTSISVAIVNSATSRNYRIGARIEDNKLIMSITGILNNMNVSGLILTSSYSTGVILTPDFTNLPAVKTIASLSGYVQES